MAVVKTSVTRRTKLELDAWGDITITDADRPDLEITQGSETISITEKELPALISALAEFLPPKETTRAQQDYSMGLMDP